MGPVLNSKTQPPTIELHSAATGSQLNSTPQPAVSLLTNRKHSSAFNSCTTRKLNSAALYPTLQHSSRHLNAALHSTCTLRNSQRLSCQPNSTIQLSATQCSLQIASTLTISEQCMRAQTNGTCGQLSSEKAHISLTIEQRNTLSTTKHLPKAQYSPRA